MLVEFEPGRVPGLLDMAGMEIELSGMPGRKVDLRAAGELSDYFRDAVVPSALPQYERIPAETRIMRGVERTQPLSIEVEREEDGRILASVPDLPGVMAYGETQEAAVRKVKSIALQVLAEMKT